MSISFDFKGDLKNTEKFLARMSRGDIFTALEKYGNQGVAALAAATPKESGETANSWTFEIKQSRGGATITWLNTHVNNGSNIAILLQYGHGTGTGGYVQGRDYINPAVRPVFDKIAADVWKEVTK
jgi:hypothetical protein